MLDVNSQKRPDRADGAIVDWQSRRQQIVENVTDLYIERPWVNVSIEAIADRADLSFWQVYYSFDCQEDVYRAVIERFFSRIESAIQSVPPANCGVRDAIASFVEWLADLFLSEDYCRLCYVALRDGPSEPWIGMKLDRRIRNRIRESLIREIVAAGQRQGIEIVCDQQALKLNLSVLEASTALFALLTDQALDKEMLEQEKRKTVTEIWKSSRNAESAIFSLQR